MPDLRSRPGRILLPLTGFLCLLPGLLVAIPASGGVTIHCLDVGQGDSTLIVSSSGQSMLVDGGEDGLGVSIIVPYLIDLGINDLDFMVATHYHIDHIGGIPRLLAFTSAEVMFHEAARGHIEEGDRLAFPPAGRWPSSALDHK